MIPKFRAWDKDSKVMREIQHLVWAEDNLIAHCPPRGHEFSEWFTVILNGWEYQLMQSTGLKDKNGVEIFEGDVVYYDPFKTHMNDSIVVFEKGSFCKKTIRNGKLTSVRFIDSEEYEVIGNVWDNPELLEEAE
ncbi:hypothetical protein EID31_13850 [Enterococcus faecalis]|nr:hypothetical protein [Enterococcus faecalis]